MTQLLGIIIIVFLFFYFVWPAISRWLQRKAMEKAEDYMRASMGMPPREKKRRGRKKNDTREDYSSGGAFYTRSRGAQKPHEPLIPKEYAEDIEFVEIKEFRATEIRQEKSHRFETYHESQISDVEWIEIKKSGSK